MGKSRAWAHQAYTQAVLPGYFRGRLHWHGSGPLNPELCRGRRLWVVGVLRWPFDCELCPCSRSRPSWLIHLRLWLPAASTKIEVKQESEELNKDMEFGFWLITKKQPTQPDLFVKQGNKNLLLLQRRNRLRPIRVESTYKREAIFQ